MPRISTDPNALLRLQILVLALGESKNFDWWKCSFLSPAGISFLQRLYPRAFFWNAVRSSSIAARTIHDSAIGIGSVFHLFRLSPEVERALEDLSQQERLQLMAEVTPMLGDRAKLIESLQTIAVGESAKAQPGPVKLGSRQELAKSEYISKMASLYSLAFLNGIKTFPYFEGPAAKNDNK